jgi:VWFA-related protein
MATWILTAGLVGAQAAQDPQKQEIPDAPSTAQPPQNFPNLPQTTPPGSNGPAPTRPTEQPAPSELPPNEPPPGTKPPFKMDTVPQGGATADQNGGMSNGQEQLFKIKTNVNQVLIPVRVLSTDGRPVDGLLSKDFTVLEDNIQQKMNFFTSDPFTLSAAVVIDTGMADVAVQKINETYSALEGAFSRYDEVAVYTFSSTYSRVDDFVAAGKQLTATLDQLKSVKGRNNGPPVTSGPLGPGGPIVNGYPLDPGQPTVYTPPKEAHVLNDAILAAARDLAKRERSRRKIIFVISNGREWGSRSSYKDVLKVLLANGILVYGIGVEEAAIPGYNKIRFHLPKFGYTDLLPKYANATGGQVTNDYRRDSIEAAYVQAIGDARNLYTLGYTTRVTPSSTYRQIEVRVDLQGVKVFAKDGYYPLPSAR